MMCVIGSGPAGVSAAYALVAAGHKVLMLDVGLELERDAQTIVARMSGSDKSSWRPSDLAQLRGSTKATVKGVPLKYAYGSDYPYREAEAGIQLIRRKADLLPSFARGGLSNVWGATLLPGRKGDMTDWPISPDDLAPSFSAVHQFLPMAGVRDGLEEDYPLYGDPFELPASRQAVRLLQDLEEHPLPGLHFGRSRLALKKGCVLCGMCLYGCPYGLIYNSSDTLSYLRTLPNFTYQAATLVRRLEESGGQVVIVAEHAGDPVRLRADSVFVAAGTLASTRIILASLDAFGHSLPVKSSQHFFFPLVRPHRSPGVSTEELHTLSQAFLEVSDPELSPYTIHLQCYTYNDLFPAALEHSLGRLFRILPRKHLLDRLLLMQGYLHSDHSEPMRLTLERNGLLLEGMPSRNTHKIVRGVMKKLRPFGHSFSPDVGLPGRGFHAGGSLPMRRSPSAFETDVWGRPKGFERVHVVDASIFPSIPASTITYTAMANAYRIASEFGRAQHPTNRVLRCAITGANGYVGGALADVLRQQGFEVILLIRRPLGPARSYSLEGPLSPDVLKGVDVLVHAAHDFSILDAELSRQVHVDGSRRLFDAAQKARIRHTVFISSLSAYEGCRSGYGQTKLDLEAIARSYGASIVRPGLVFGPRPGGMLGTLRRLSSCPVIPLVGNGEQLLYMAHQDDLGMLVAHLLHLSGTGSELPIAAAHAQPVMIKDILRSFTSSTKVFLPLPGKGILFGLRMLESLGYSSRMRSDSLQTLLVSAPPPDFTTLASTGVSFRPFLSK